MPQTTARLDAGSSVIQTYEQMRKHAYMDDVPSDEVFSERPLFSSTITRVVSSPLTSVRTQDIADAIAEDYYALIILKSGAGYWMEGDQHHPLTAGSCIFIKANRTFTFHFTERYEVVSFNFCAKLLAQLNINDIRHGAILTSQQYLMLAAQLGQVHDEALVLAADDAEQQATAAVANVLKALASHEEQVLQQTLTYVKHLIEKHAEDEGFGIEQLVAISGFSRRYLFKLFAKEPLTLNQFIQQRQLQAGFQRLTDPALCHQSILDIAGSCGFKSQAHFTRLFKARFSTTPSKVRSALQEALAFDLLQ